ncbi:hypothetical protein L6164_036166 [Bauhinia variegata]|uniref:Uncharacterized protein n=1 Tax=Bauhinia variegata TaxID=167791 RepID=A0ACB9KG60_BAUVA|nr:hypothetical protein L6164_036166 [Bauhinia variegata]
MGGESENEKTESMATETADPSQKLGDTDVASLKDGTPFDATSSMSASGNATSVIKDEESAVYGSEALPCYSRVSTSVDVQNGTTNRSVTPKSGPQSSALEKRANLKSTVRTSSLTSKYCKSMPASRNDIKLLNKAPLRSNLSLAGLPRTYQPMGKFSSLSSQQAQHRHVFSPGYHSQHGRLSNMKDNHMSRDKFYRNGESHMSTELTWGPRGRDKNTSLQSSSAKEEFGLSIRRDEYNLSDFQTEYQDAKFYMIKSFNEDDIHKCIKYDVWTSTRYGNTKLNAAFSDAEAKANKTGTKCPVFLFFSVNASGQFVGVAEMIGPVDFNKDLDFWKLDKYNGFFPVKWHIIKDVPNSQFRYIILENNDNKRVTFSRDTQEIGLKQGLEMLNIFKRYSAKTSLLDDFDFYEEREKLFRSQKNTKPTTMQRKTQYSNHNYLTVKAGDRKIELHSGGPKQFASSTSTSLINLTKKLSLNPSSMDSKIL